jgi:putative toxin-antitoxin system antitoxin component (TIGR02293 family)
MNERAKTENFSGTSAQRKAAGKSEAAFEKLMSFGYSSSELMRFAIPHSLLVAQLQNHQRIELPEKDVARIVDIFEFADQVFGNRQKAQRWLREPCRAMDNVVPLDLLQSSEGAELVRDELLRIEHGIYA